MNKAPRKHSYTVPCSSSFRDEVSRLAVERGVNVADLARSVVLVLGEEEINAYPDPGGPAAHDRETVILKSGKSKGQPWIRKPRLQVRMAPGLDVETLRRALGLALAVENGEVDIRVDEKKALREEQEKAHTQQAARLKETQQELERLRSVISQLSFQPLRDGVRSRGDALHILGFPPGSMPDNQTMRARFRSLASIHHPDSGHGSHDRMSQLNEAMEYLRRGVS